MLMSSLTRRVLHVKSMTIGMLKRKAIPCVRCPKKFVPTGTRDMRCPPCRRLHFLESCKKRWHRTYVKKGYNQKGENNNAWSGGSSPQYYQQVAFKAHGRKCMRCGKKAVLVHHKDENRKNNSPSNLEVLCKRCHQLEHRCADNLPTKVKFKARICTICSKRYRPTGPRQLRCTSCRT